MNEWMNERNLQWWKCREGASAKTVETKSGEESESLKLSGALQILG